MEGGRDAEEEGDDAPLNLKVPQYNLTPSVETARRTPDPRSIPRKDWRECAVACSVLLIVAAFGLVCGFAGYRLNTCKNGNRTIFKNQ